MTACVAADGTSRLKSPGKSSPQTIGRSATLLPPPKNYMPSTRRALLPHNVAQHPTQRTLGGDNNVVSNVWLPRYSWVVYPHWERQVDSTISLYQLTRPEVNIPEKGTKNWKTLGEAHLLCGMSIDESLADDIKVTILVL